MRKTGYELLLEKYVKINAILLHDSYGGQKAKCSPPHHH